MKKNIRKLIRCSLHGACRRLIPVLLFLFIGIGFQAIGQGAGAPGDPGPDPDHSSTEVPVDGGITVLLVAAGAYGAARIRKSWKKKN